MRAEDLLDAIGNVRASYIADARFQKKNYRWISWAAAVAACLGLLIGVGTFLRSRDTAYPPIPWPQAGGAASTGTEFSLTPELTLPDTAAPIAVYTPVAPDMDALCAELAAFHGLENVWKENELHRYIATDICLLEVEKGTGYWTFQDRTVDRFSAEPSVLTDVQAIEIAKETAAEYGLDLRVFSDIQVGYGTMGTAETPIGQEVIVSHDVYFYPTIGGYSTWGICRFVVSVNGTGQVSSVMKLYPEWTLHAMEEAVSPAEAFRAIQKGNAHFPEAYDAASVIFHSYEIVYYVDFEPSEQLKYCQPVYVFYGNCLDADGQVCGDNYTVMYPVLGEHRFRSR